MRLFDPHVHMTSRTTDDYRAMAAAGVAVVVEPSSWPGHPRRHVGTFEDYFAGLLGFERLRASRFGIRHFCGLGLDPREANDPPLARGVLELLPRYLDKDGVVAVGEVGYEALTEEEDWALVRQLDLARRHRLPVLVRAPRGDKKRGTRRILDVLRELAVPPGRVLIDHNDEETLPLVIEGGYWAGHSMEPSRLLALLRLFGPERLVVDSSAGWDVSDPLKVPRTVAALLEAALPPETVQRVFWDNPAAFFSQSGRLDLDAPADGGPAEGDAAPLGEVAL